VTKARVKKDLVVIGAGSGGLSVAAGAAQLGLSVTLFERGEMGGDCLNYGCVPSKALIAAASAAHAMRSVSTLGTSCEGAVTDFAQVMRHVSGTIAGIAPHDSQERFEALGVQVVREQARFLDHHTVAGATISVEARRIIIATGSRPTIPPIPGLDGVAYLTNETIFGLAELPRKLLVVGGGPIGVELGQAFRRLGSQVVIIDSGPVLGREEPDAAQVVIDQLRSEGVELLADHRILEVGPGPSILVEQQGASRRIEGSHILIAVGRSPSLDALDLDKAGIDHDAQGIRTRRNLRTSNRRVYAVGDVAGRGQFTHLAGAHAALVIRNAFFRLPVNADAMVVPRVTYADPELAAVGMSEAAARDKHGERVRVERFEFADNDRARTEADVRGFGKLIATRGGKIVGVTLVGRSAGDHIHLWALAMSSGLKLRHVAGIIAPYPTRGEIGKRLAGQFFTGALFSSRTRKLVSILKRLP
jgi:pyruvate/2-oxoglutarate dehydrogenase complex dihydrolipoamide dehydrogenase (E3) component